MNVRTRDWMTLLVTVAVLSAPLGGIASDDRKLPVKESPPFVSDTFRDILSRVVNRDPATGVILSVKPKSDAPPLGYGLRFRMKKLDQQEIVDVTLYRNLKTGDDVFERYQLRVDTAVRFELLKLQRFEDAQAAEAKFRVTQQAKEIERVTKGLLKQGMTIEEVVELKGDPLPRAAGPEPPGPQAAELLPTSLLRYRGLDLVFLGGKLQRVLPKK